MNTTINDRVRSNLIDRHNSLSNALEVAAKVQMLLPGDVILSGWRADPGKVSGQLAFYPDSDVSAIAMVTALSQMPGWSLHQDEPRSVNILHEDHTFIQIAAVTEMNGVSVHLWTHISAEIALHAGERLVAA